MDHIVAALSLYCVAAVGPYQQILLLTINISCVNGIQRLVVFSNSLLPLEWMKNRDQKRCKREFGVSDASVHKHMEASLKSADWLFYLKVLPQKSLQESTLPAALGPQDIAAEDAALRLLLLQIDALVSRY